VDQVTRILVFLLSALGVFTTIDQYNALVGATLTRGRTPANQPIGAGATITMDAPVGGADWVTLEASMTGTAAGDLTVTCMPYDAYGNLMGTPLPAVINTGYAGTLVGAKTYLVQKYDVQGIDKVQFQIKNNNAGAQTLNANWRTESW
jgi:hypothetical protein